MAFSLPGGLRPPDTSVPMGTPFRPLPRPEIVPLYKPPERQLGGMDRFFRTLDRPGLAIRSLLEGDPGAAAKHIINLVPEAFTLGMLTPEDFPIIGDPWKKYLSTTKEEEPDWGFIGNIISDPLVYFTFGGAGAAKAVGKATTKSLAKAAFTKSLTKVGRKLLKSSADDHLKTLGKGFTWLHAKDDILEGIIKESGKGWKISDDVIKKWGTKSIKQGGLKIGLPFMEGKTIAAAGTDLSYHMPWRKAGRTIGKIPIPGIKSFKTAGGSPVPANIGNLLSTKFKPLAGISDEGVKVIKDFQYNVNRTIREFDDTFDSMVAAMKDMGKTDAEIPDAIHKIITSIEGVDVTILNQAKNLTTEVGEAAIKSADDISKIVDEDEILHSMRQFLNVELGRALPGRGDPKSLITHWKRGGLLDANPIVRLQQARKHAAQTELQDVINFGKPKPTKPATAGRRMSEGAEVILESPESEEFEKIGKKAATEFNYWFRKRMTLGPRGTAGQAIHAVSAPFKRAVTGGVGPVPNIAFHSRNLISGLVQGAMDPDIGMRTFSALSPKVNSIIHNLNKPQALLRMKKIAGHTASDFVALLKDLGVVNVGFAAQELAGGSSNKFLTKTLGMSAKKASKAMKVWNKVDYSTQLMAGTENRMRASAFATLLDAGIDAKAAAQRVKDVFVDYDFASDLHRGARDIIPFFQYSAGMLPKLIDKASQSPRFFTPFREAKKSMDRGSIMAVPGMEIGDSSKPPVLASWMQEQIGIPLGRTTEGKPLSLTGFGTPPELFNLMRSPEGKMATLKEGLLGQLAPTLKVPAELMTGQDFFRGGKLSNTRTPKAFQFVGVPEKIDPRWRKIMDLNPLTRQFGYIDTLIDDRKSWLQKSLQILTGARLTETNEKWEVKKLIKNYLEEKVRAGDAKTFERFYTDKAINPELAALIKDFYRKNGK